MKRVFIAGVPRTGSMWTFNVTRSLLKASGKDILPKESDPLINENKVLNEAYTSEFGVNTVYCIKTHNFLNNDLPETKVIVNYRDVRDSMISYIRFMKLEKVDNFFEKAKEILSNHITDTNYYFEEHKNNLKIKFNDILHNPISVIKDINNYLSLNVEEEQIFSIEGKFSKKNISKLIEKLEKVSVLSSGFFKDKSSIETYQKVRNRDGSYRVLDRKTNFQTNHITSKKDGEWVKYFNSQQREEINNLASEWLNKHNFQI